jgi:hypothetical protein
LGLGLLYRTVLSKISLEFSKNEGSAKFGSAFFVSKAVLNPFISLLQPQKNPGFSSDPDGLFPPLVRISYK